MEQFPWRNPPSVSAIVAKYRDLLERERFIQKGKRVAPAAIERMKARFGASVSAELVEFLSVAAPQPPLSNNGPDSFGFYLPNDQMQVLTLAQITGEEEFAGTEAFLFGQTVYGDVLMILRNHPTVPDSYIANFSEGDFVVLARSFAEYLLRLCLFDGVDSLLFGGAEVSANDDLKAALAREKLELNPSRNI